VGGRRTRLAERRFSSGRTGAWLAFCWSSDGHGGQIGWRRAKEEEIAKAREG